jgi:hypothetical protein
MDGRSSPARPSGSRAYRWRWTAGVGAGGFRLYGMEASSGVRLTGSHGRPSVLRDAISPNTGAFLHLWKANKNYTGDRDPWNAGNAAALEPEPPPPVHRTGAR